MTHRWSRLAPGIALVLVAAAFSGQAVAGSLEGRWKLEDEHYGEGGGNLAARKAPVFLEISPRPGEPAVYVWMGDDPGRAVAWPAYLSGEQSQPVEILERSLDLLGGRIRVRYRVRSAPGDELVLEIVEQYALAGDGESLQGSATVSFLRGDEPRGSFVLHRRFVRSR